MSILIKGMEMPKEGRLTLQISADGAVYVVNSCSITAETYTTDAVPVPPHGRLIDADAMAELWKGCVIEGSIKPLLETRPTVIAAEEG